MGGRRLSYSSDDTEDHCVGHIHNKVLNSTQRYPTDVESVAFSIKDLIEVVLHHLIIQQPSFCSKNNLNF